MSATAHAEARGRQAANSKPMEWAARAGFVARGTIYLLIGLIAVQIGLGRGGRPTVAVP